MVSFLATALDRLAAGANAIGTLVVLALVGVVNFDVVARGAFNAPFLGAVEVVHDIPFFAREGYRLATKTGVTCDKVAFGSAGPGARPKVKGVGRGLGAGSGAGPAAGLLDGGWAAAAGSSFRH